METETLIVGGGLTGLALAADLSRRGQACHLVEARDRLGGRILTRPARGTAHDLGPAWVWPGQPRIAALLAAKGLRVFAQHVEGAAIHEDPTGAVERLPGYAPMRGARRVDGGLGALIDALAAEVPRDRVTLHAPVTGIARLDEGIAAQLPGGTVRARRVVLALPPRLAASIAVSPALPPAASSALAAIPTWMAGQAKAVALYDRAFWRAAGLSGHAVSRRGPLVEVHDATPAGPGAAALFGFIGIPLDGRGEPARLRQAIADQLGRLFGAEAATPASILLKDWAGDPFTATALDRQPLRAHPRYGRPDALDMLWGGRLILAATELAAQNGGLLEGALEAAAAAAERLTEANV